MSWDVVVLAAGEPAADPFAAEAARGAERLAADGARVDLRVGDWCWDEAARTAGTLADFLPRVGFVAGPAYLVHNVEPRLRALGITDAELHVMRVTSPQRVLDHG